MLICRLQFPQTLIRYRIRERLRVSSVIPKEGNRDRWSVEVILIDFDRLCNWLQELTGDWEADRMMYLLAIIFRCLIGFQPGGLSARFVPPFWCGVPVPVPARGATVRGIASVRPATYVLPGRLFAPPAATDPTGLLPRLWS